MSPKRWIPIAVLVAAAAIVLATDLHSYLTFDALREHRATLTEFVANNTLAAAVLYVLIYTASTALSLPGGAALSIAGGFLFGALLGGLCVVLGATVGATLIFLAARTVFSDLLRERAGPWLSRMRDGFQNNALSYLLMLRLIPLFPFFVVNLVPAFLGVSLRVYVFATFVGILPGVMVFTFAGAGIGAVLDSGEEFTAASILTPKILIALTGLGILAMLPVLYKRFIAPRRAGPGGTSAAEDESASQKKNM